VPPTQTLDPVLAATPLSKVVESPRAAKALEAAGFKTLGDVAEKGLDAARRTKFVGESSIALIAKAIGPQQDEPAADEGEIEEGVHDVRLESPYAEFKIGLRASGKVPEPGGGFAIAQPLYIEFSRGEGRLTKRMFLERILGRGQALETAMRDAAYKWRGQATDWLRQHGTHKRGEFRVLTD
jgi:hypothetical protein